jgi:hypothetical protein
MGDREQACSGAVGHADLQVDVLDMPAGGLGRDAQPVGDFPVRVAAGQQPKHFDLASGQS